MNLYTISVLNPGYRVNPHDRTVVFKNKNQACRMIKNWVRHNPNVTKTNLMFEIKKTSFEQLPANKDILIVNDLSRDYYPFSFVNLDKYRDLLEETWKNL